ncbi:MAG: D-alanyl-D-alanine carboxypeptidase, partial [Myxococcota bacterium]
TQTSPTGDPWAVVPTPPTLPSGVLDDLADAIDAIVDGTSYTTGVYVVDAENGQVVYARDEDLPKTPASNTKLFTTAVALDSLGVDHRMEVSLWAAAPGAALDEAVLVGEHDFTWSSWFYPTAEFPADRMADLAWDAGVRSIDTLVVSGQFELEGYELGYYDADYYRAAAADAVWTAFEARGISLGTVDTAVGLEPPGGWTELARRGSPTLGVACHPLLVYSHNEFADLLGQHEGWLLAGEDSPEAGGEAVADWLAAAGIDTTGLELYDGSGLSHANAVTPRQIVEMEAYLFDRPAGLAWRRGFSTAGVLGTLGSRMTGPDTLGRFVGKTGTLTGVIATSGVLHHAHDGHRYLISVLMNDVGDSTTARGLQDDIVEVVAADLRRLGARPARPELLWVRSPADGTLELGWDPVDGADGYVVWLSDDARVWRRSDARFVTPAGFVAGDLPLDAARYVRITAVNGAGESDASDVLAGWPSLDPPSVLVVDGNDRWHTPSQWENPTGGGHDFVAEHARALGGRPFDTADHRSVADGEVDLSAYEVVVWASGEESSEDETFDDLEQLLVADAVTSGTRLFVSGAELAWDLGLLGAPTDQGFLTGVLGVDYAGDDAETYSAAPVAGGLFDGVGELGFYSPGTQDVSFPDQLEPVGGAPALEYLGGLGGTAAVVRDGVVVFGFPFESIDGEAVRAEVMGRILTGFGA